MAGLIHVYTGDGKGKTTAACGLALRAVGQGMNVLMVQFLKSGKSGEIYVFEKFLNITAMASGTDGFLWDMTDKEKEETKKIHKNLFETASAQAKEFDMIIFDEIFGAITSGMIEESKVLDFLKNKPKTTEVVLTGRGATEKLIEIADYVSEIKCVKHPMEKNIPARRGIEY